MNRFSATVESEAVVAARREAIWDVLTDPDLLARLTPLLDRIETDGEARTGGASLWRWHMMSIKALGVSVSPAFTERMRFERPARIDYRHEPPAGAPERSGADGWYVLSEDPGGTRLAIKLTLHVMLPLPRAARPAVTRVMRTTMLRTGDRFSANLLHHLGIAGGAGGSGAEPAHR